MRLGCVVLVVIAGCGRLGFEVRVGEDAAAELEPRDGRVPITPAFVQTYSARNPGFASVTASLPADVMAGNLLLVGVEFSPGAPFRLTGVTDDKNNRYSLLGPFDGLGDLRHYLAYAIARTSGPTTITSTLDGAPSPYYSLRLHEYASTAQTGPIEVSAFATGTDSSIDGARSGLITTTEPNELLFGYATFFGGSPGTGTEFTTRSTFDGDLTEDRLAPTPGGYEVTATMLGGSQWTVIGAAIRGR